jgi:hypothetical protein
MSDVYPSEVWVTEGEVEQLDGVTDPPTGLPYIAKGVGPTSSPSYEVQYNRRQQRANKVLEVPGGGRVVADGDLSVGVFPFDYTLGGAAKRFLGATNESVLDDGTSYVYIDSSNALQVVADADGWPTDPTLYFPLAEVTAADGSITSVRDVRGRGRNTVVGALEGRHTGELGVNGGIPMVFTAALVAGSTVSIHDGNAPFAYRVVDAWSVAMSGDGGSWQLEDGASAITDTVAVTATDGAIDRAGHIDDAYHEIGAEGTLRVVGDGSIADVAVYILAVRVS